MEFLSGLSNVHVSFFRAVAWGFISGFHLGFHSKVSLGFR